MTTKLEKIEQVRVVYRGLTQTARNLGCSRAHLSYVLHGKRKPSDRLARALRRMGVELPAKAFFTASQDDDKLIATARAKCKAIAERKGGVK